jgi:hypothetical protein
MRRSPTATRQTSSSKSRLVEKCRTSAGRYYRLRRISPVFLFKEDNFALGILRAIKQVFPTLPECHHAVFEVD